MNSYKYLVRLKVEKEFKDNENITKYSRKENRYKFEATHNHELKIISNGTKQIQDDADNYLLLNINNDFIEESANIIYENVCYVTNKM